NRIVTDANLRTRTAAPHNGDVIDADVLLNRVVLVARRRLARGPIEVAGVAGTELALAVFDIGNGGAVAHHQRYADEDAFARDLVAGLADSMLFPVVGGDELGRMIVRHGAMGSALEGVLAEHFRAR